jgi:exosortase E/protease (VPEID-CTERM system)
VPLPIGVRWSGLIGLFAFEVVTLTIRFDTQTLESGPRWLERFFDLLPLVFDAAVVGTSVVLLVLWPQLRTTLQSPPVWLQSHKWSRYLGLHLAAFAGLFALTGPLMEARPGFAVSLAALTSCWVALVLLWVLTWISCFASPRECLLLLRRSHWILLAGMAVGLGEPVVRRVIRSLGEPLAASTLELVRLILRHFSRDLVYLPAKGIIGTASFDVEIAPECSGYEGMGLVLVLLGAFLLISRRTLRFPRSLWLLPLGCLSAYLANAIRIVALILLGTHVSSEIALGGFHSRAGVLLFLIVGFGLMALALQSRVFSITDPQRGTKSDSTPSEAYLCPFMALVGMTLVTGAFSSGFDPLYPLGMIVTCGLLWHYRKYYDDLVWTFAPLPVVIGVLVFVIWLAFELLKTGQSSPVPPIPLRGEVLAAWCILRALGSVLVTPLAEELAFRGYLIRRLIAGDFQSVPQGSFSWPSFLLSSLLFGMLHERWIAGIIAGLLYAAALYSRRRLADAVVAHATSNALIATHVLASGNWSMWT